MAEGHREAAPRVLDGREHDGSLAAEGRRHITRHIAVYPRNLTAANKLRLYRAPNSSRVSRAPGRGYAVRSMAVMGVSRKGFAESAGRSV